MLPQKLENNNEPLPGFSPKFVRRPDLTPEIRFNIAYLALMARMLHSRGVIPALVQQYDVCRMFIYSLSHILEEAIPLIFFPQETSTTPVFKKWICTIILAYRLEGRASIGAISTLMKRFDQPFSSVGFISQNLSQMGKLLPCTLKIKGGKTITIPFLSDEIFFMSIPILITADAVSSAILKIELASDRKGETWAAHYRDIQANGFEASSVVSDAGVGLLAGQKEALPNVIFQPDTFHAISHRIGIIAIQLENSAYSAIQVEFDREDVLNSARSDKVMTKRLIAYFNAFKKSGMAIDYYDNFIVMYHELLYQLRVFDNNGNLRNKTQVEENIEVVLGLMEELENKKINKEVASIRNALPDLLHYFDQAETAVNNCKKLGIDEEAFKALCLAWHWDKVIIKSKAKKRRDRAIEEKKICLEFASELLDEKYKDSLEKVFAELENIVQASSIVECINSVLRPYLNNSKNQVTQEFLNLFMFYHNHRRYTAGKRKGKTPMEILTGQEQKEDWTDILLKTIEEKDPEFFL